MNVSLLKLAMIILGVVLVMCVAGIIYLSAQNPARPIPDILVGSTTLIIGGMIGLLVPTKTSV